MLAVFAGLARAADVVAGASDPAAATPREMFLAAGIGAMIACAVTSFFLAGRVTERTHVALAMLVVLIGGFCLFVLFGLVGRELPIAGFLVFLGLIGLFKLMNQFEIRRTRVPRTDKTSDEPVKERRGPSTRRPRESGGPELAPGLNRGQKTEIPGFPHARE